MFHKHHVASSRLSKNIAFLCLFLQTFFILSSVALPVRTAFAAAKISEMSATDLAGLPPQPYVLRPGENPEMVATKLGLTLAQLQAFNQFRTFRVPFVQLGEGDEIDVPVLNRRNSKSGSAPDETKMIENGQETNADAARLAGSVQSLAETIQNGNNNGSAGEMARSKVTSTTNDAVQQWLGKYGTVQSQLNLGENASLEGSSIDWLVPLYDTPESMLFIQSGARNQNDRNTVNVGWGMRWFQSGWMYGANNFFDHDLTGNNRRIGLGLEARTDYLKFSGNSYMRLSDWHQSMDFADYDERPANGFDVRMEGWLPAYPQFGGKMMYEKYYGDEVALFGKDDRQKDPYAATIGLNWTPFPMMTVGMDKRLGKNGENDTSLKLQLTWRPDEPLNKQLSPEAVKGTRLLENSRYDLVDRNNNIMLEYRKQQLINLALSSINIQGAAGSSHPLAVTVKSKYGVKNVTVNADGLKAAGGEVKILDATHFLITLPPYKTVQLAQAAKKGATMSAPDIHNTYYLDVIAEDSKGNFSRPETTTVTTLPPNISFASELTVTNDYATADGTQAVTVVAAIDDGYGHPVVDQKVTISVTYSDGSTGSWTEVTDTEGRVSWEITSLVAGVAKVDVTADSVTKSTEINFTSSGIDATHSALKISPNMIVANGVVGATLTLQARNDKGDAVSNKTAELTFPVSGVSNVVVDKIVESPAGSGNYTAQVSGTTAGIATFGTAMNGAVISNLATSLTLIGDSQSARIVAAGGLSVVSDNAVANGIATNSVQARVTDENNNPVPGVVVAFNTDNGAVISASGTTGSDGTVSMNLSSSKTGLSNVTASVNGSSQTVQTHFVVGDVDIARSTLTVEPATILADGIQTSILKATLKDANGNSAAGFTVNFHSSLANSSVSNVTNNNDGTYTATLSGTSAGLSTVTMTVNGTNPGLSTLVNLTADSNSVSINSGDLVVVSNHALASGSAVNIIKATVTDANDNPVSGVAVNFTADNGAVIKNGGTTGSDGAVSMPLTSTTTGVSNVTASLNGSSETVQVHFVAGILDTSRSTLMAIPSQIKANGSQTSILTATLKDANGNPVTGKGVGFHSSLPNTLISPVTDNHDGTWTATLSGSRAGVSTVSMTVNGANSGLSTQVTLKADNSTAEITRDNLVVMDDDALANGQATNSVQVTVTDAKGNPVPDIAVTFSADNRAAIAATGTTRNDGTVNMVLTSTMAGVSKVTASVNGSSQSVQVHFMPGDVDANHSSLTVAPATIVADGVQTSTLTATLRDVTGNPLTGNTVVFRSSLASTSVSAVTDNNNGTYTAFLSGSTAGMSTVTLLVNGSNLGLSQPVTLMADISTGRIEASDLIVVADNAYANGRAMNAVKSTVKDANGNPVPNITVAFAADNGAVINSGGTTDSDGNVIVMVTSTSTGASNVTATVNGSSQTVQVHFTQGSVDVTKSSLTAVPVTILANGIEQSILTATLKDVGGNPVTGANVTFQSSLVNSTIGTVTENNDGTYRATLSGNTAGRTLVRLVVNGVSPGLSTPVTLKTDDRTAEITSGDLIVTNDDVLANGLATNSVAARVTDAKGNPVAGMDVMFTADNGAVIGTSGTTSSNGLVSMTLTSTTAGVSHVTAEVNGSSQTVKVRFVAGAIDAAQSSLIAVPATITANGTAHSTLTATLKDATGNVLPGKTVVFRSSLVNTSVSTVTDNNDGTYTAALSGTTSGVSIMSVMADGNNPGLSSSVTLIADRGTAEIATGELIVTDDDALANGRATNSVAAQVTDATGNPVAGVDVTFTADNGAVVDTSGTTGSDGMVSITLTSSKAGVSHVTAAVNGSSQTVPTHFVAGAVDTTRSSLIGMPATIVANGTEQSTLTATLVDAAGNALTGKKVMFRSSLLNTSVSTVTDNGDGTYTASLSGTTAGRSVVNMTIDGSSIGIFTSVILTEDSGTADLTAGALSVVSDNAYANGNATNNVKATVKDAHGNPVSGVKVTFTADNGAVIGAIGTTGSDGTVNMALTSTVTGTSNVTASVNDSHQTTAVRFIANSIVDTPQSSLIAAPPVIVANGSDRTTLMATLKDAAGNPLAGNTVVFRSSLMNTSLSTVTDNGDGTYTAILSGTTSGASTITLMVNGGNPGLSTAVMLKTDDSTAGIPAGRLVVTDDNAAADGVTTNSVSTRVTDATGNPVAGVDVTFTADNGAVIGTSGATGSDGTVSMTLASTKAGVSNVTAIINGSSQTVQTHFIAGVIDATRSTLIAAPETIVANGNESSTLTATLQDANGNPLTGNTVVFRSSLMNTSLSTVTDNGDGTYTALLNGTSVGSSTVTVMVNGANSGLGGVVTLTSDRSTAEITNGNLNVTDDGALADGMASNRVAARVTDTTGNPVAGVDVTFAADSGVVIGAYDTTDSDGIVNMALNSTVAGVRNVTATVNGSSQTVQTRFVAGVADATESSLIAVPATIVANGIDRSTLVATLRDVNGNPLVGKTVVFRSSLVNTSVSTVVDNGDGTYIATLGGTTTGDSTVTLNVNGGGQGLSAVVTLTADDNTAGIAAGRLKVLSDDAVADGVSTNTVAARVTDATGNPVVGIDVTFDADNGAVIGTSGITGSDGTISMDLLSTKAGVSNVTATINGSSQTVQARFVAGDLDANHSSLIAAPVSIVANGKDQSTLTATLKDAGGNPVIGAGVVFQSSLQNTSVGTVTDNNDGTYTAILSGTRAGVSMITLNVNGGSPGLTTSVTLTADNDTAEITNLAVTDDDALADDMTTNSVAAQVIDATGNPVVGITVAFTADNGTVIGASGITDMYGMVSMDLTSKRAGESNVTATVNGRSQTVQMSFTAGAMDTLHSSLIAVPETIVANGTESSTLTATLQDANGNPLAGKSVVFLSPLTNTSISAVADNGDGTYTAILSGTKAGVSHVTVTENGGNTDLSAAVALTADNRTAEITTGNLLVTDDDAVADGRATNNVSARVTDATGNPVVGAVVAFTADNGVIIGASGTTGSDGAVSMDSTSIKAGLSNITAVVNGSSQTVQVHFVAGAVDAAHSSLIVLPTTIVADGVQTSTLTATLKDTNNNPATGRAVEFDSTLASTSVSTVTDNGDGTYTATLTGALAGTTKVATIVNGYTASSLSATVTLLPGAPAAITSSLSASLTTIVADGMTPSQLTLTLKDKTGNLLTGQDVELTSSLTGTSLGPVRDNGNGTYTASLTGVSVGTTTIAALVGSSALAITPVSVTLVSGTADASQSSVDATPATIVANGNDSSLLTAILKDAQGNPVVGQSVVFRSNPATTSISAVTDNGDGTYTATITGTHVGVAVVAPVVNGYAASGMSTTVTLVPGLPDVAASSLIASPTTIVADDTMSSLLTLTLEDITGNPVPGKSVSLVSSLSGTTLGAVSDNGDGTYTASLKGAAVGTTSITAFVGGNPFGVSSASVVLVGNISATNSILTAVPTTITADGSDSSALTLQLKDQHNNAIPGIAVQFVTDLPGQHISAVTDHGNGAYTATLNGTQSGRATVLALTNGNMISANPTTVILTAGAPSDILSTLTASPTSIVADGTEQSILTLELNDANGNPVTGKTVAYSSSLGNVTFVSNTESGTPGTYTVSMQGTTAGMATITANVDGSDVKATQVNLRNGPIFTNTSTLTASPPTIVADNTEQSLLTLELKDEHNNPIVGKTVVYTSSLDNVTFSYNVEAGTPGTYTVNMKGTKSGTATITAKVDGNNVKTTQVALVAGLPSGTTSTLTANPTSIRANNTELSTLTLVLKDAYNNPVTGKAVVYSSNLGNVTFSNNTESGTSGIYTVKMKGSRTGTATITANVDGRSIKTTTVTLWEYASLTGDIQTITNPATFTLTSGFPSTGTPGAKFRLRINNNASNNSGYNWSVVSGGNATVDSSGVVSITGKGQVTIAAASKTNSTRMSYTFNVTYWGYPISGGGNASSNQNECTNRGHSMIPQSKIVNVSNKNRLVGTLYGEWGDLGYYGWTTGGANRTWNIDKNGGNNWVTDVRNGWTGNVSSGNTNHRACGY